MTSIAAESPEGIESRISGRSQALPAHRTLGGCWIAYGIFRLIVAVILALSSATATLMFGALLTRVADPYSLMSLFHVVYLCAILLSGAAGLAGIFAGLALLGGASSGRSLALMAAILSISGIPIGTTLGIFTLVALLPETPRAIPAS